MHKKILWLLIVLWTTITWITQWYNEINNCYTIWSNSNFTCTEYNIWEWVQNNDWSRMFFFNNMNFKTSDYRSIYTNNHNPSWNTNENGALFRSWNNIYYINNSSLRQIKKVCIAETDITTEIPQYCRYSNLTIDRFWTDNLNTSIEEAIQQFNWYTTIKYVNMNYQQDSRSSTICWVFNNWKSLCIYKTFSICQQYSNCTSTSWAMLAITSWNWCTSTNYECLSQFATDSPINEWSWNSEEEYKICDTVENIIKYYWNTYNTWLCYTDNKEWSWSLYTWERVTVTPKSIFEIFNWYQDYEQRRAIYVNSCHAPYTQEYCLSRMQTNPYASVFFTKIENAWLNVNNAQKLYQYCHMQINIQDKTQNSCEMDNYYATWVEEKEVTPSLIDIMMWNLREADSTLPLPEDWSVFDQILPEWILSWKNVALDLNFMKNMWNAWIKFMRLFKRREEQPWIIPPMITSLLLLFIFYKMIKK